MCNFTDGKTDFNEKAFLMLFMLVNFVFSV